MTGDTPAAANTRTGERILVLRYRFIGDTLLTVPFLRNLRRAKPDARIVWVVAPGSADVVAGIPYVDELLHWDPVTRHAESRGTHKTWRDKLAFVRALRQQRFDRVYVLKRSLTSALIGWLSGAPRRIGFTTEGRGLLLTTRVPYRHDQHEVQNFLDVLRADGVAVHDDHLEAWLTAGERLFASTFLHRHGVGPADRLIAIHPFATNKPRAWHEDNFVALANRLQAEHGGRVIVFGGPGDVADAQVLREHIKPEPIMAVGNTTLRQTMALLERCELLVCNDSGIMHLGAALRRPLVALFGPQSPVKFGPWGERSSVVYKRLPCSPCRQKFWHECEPSARGKPACMETISVPDVIAAICGALKHQPLESRMPTLRTDDGVNLYYEEAGSGTPIVFVHEFAGDHRSWEPQLRHFSRTHRCIAYNARGYPPSDVPEGAARYVQERQRDDLVAVLDGLGLRQAHVVGCSMGAFATLHFGMQHATHATTARALSLTLVGVGSGAHPAVYARFQRECVERAATIRRDGMAQLMATYGHGASRIQYLNKDPRGFAEFSASWPPTRPSARPTRWRATRANGRACTT